MKGKTSAKSTSVIKRVYKLYLISFDGPEYEDIAAELYQTLETSTRRPILVYQIEDVFIKGTTILDEGKKGIQIEQTIEKLKKLYELNSIYLAKELKEDLDAYWRGELEDEKTTVPEVESVVEKSTTIEYVNVGEFCGSCESAQFESEMDNLTSTLSDGGEEEMEPPIPPIPQYVPKLIRDIDMQTMYAELTDKDIIYPEFFIVLFGKFTMVNAMRLIRSSYPLQGVVHFVSCPLAELEKTLPEIYMDAENIRQSPDTKKIGLFVLPMLTLPDINERSEMKLFVFQFICFLFDMEMLAQQFIIYQVEFHEENDTVLHEDIVRRSWNIRAMTMMSDDTNVNVYLDSLINVLSTGSTEERRFSFSHVNPFFKNNYNRIVVEEANEILQSAIASNMNMVFYWRIVDSLVHTRQPVPDCQKCKMKRVVVPPYYECLTWESYVQYFDSVMRLFDDHYQTDFSRRCKFYALNKKFNEIISKEKKHRLTTKLCYRDYCDYVAPDLGKVIRNFNKQQDALLHEENDFDGDLSFDGDICEPINFDLYKFSGLNFRDILQELRVRVQIYRYKEYIIRCTRENWLYANQRITIELMIHKNNVYIHRWEENKQRNRLRITTKNNISCNVGLNDDWTQVTLSILWPTDNQIQYIYNNGKPFIEQKYHWSKMREQIRLTTLDGCVLNFLDENEIEVLTPNGTIYILHSKNFVDEVDYEEPRAFGYSVENINISEELQFVDSLKIYGIKNNFFDVTTPSGKKLRVQNHVVIYVLADYFVYEWIDYHMGQLLAERDDGVRMLWSSKYFKCFYPCGTTITSTVKGNETNVTLGCRSPSTENILRAFSSLGTETLDKTRVFTTTYVSYDVEYEVEHKNYATVAYKEEQLIIENPDMLHISIHESNLIAIDIDDNVVIRINGNVCSIKTRSPEMEYSGLFKLYFFSAAPEILSFETAESYVSIQNDGEMILTTNEQSTPPYTDEKFFLSQQFRYGIEFFTESNYEKIINSYNEDTYKYMPNSDLTVIFKPLFKLDEIFSMPIQNLSEMHDRFEVRCCRLKQKPKPGFPAMVTTRIFHFLPEEPEDLCKFIKKHSQKPFINEALDDFLSDKSKSKYSEAWVDRIQLIKEYIEFRKRRASLYRIMLEKQIFPQYSVFHESGDHIDLIQEDYLKNLLGLE